MKKKILPELLTLVFIFYSAIGLTGCRLLSIIYRKEPINKENTVFTLETTQANGWGSGAANQDDNLTFEKMLRYAIEDEYIKRTRYELISEKFKIDEPFYSMAKCETGNILALITLFSKHNIPVPQDKSLEYIKTPKTIEDAYNLSIKGEENNIIMYEKFLKDESLDEDAKAIFSKLRDISKENLNKLSKRENN
ncbi:MULTISPECIES: hypothetical protein [Clostridium]|jgi:hypothetical protein|uniref:Uncharacterized protein n=1 Tax=Clostridium thermopalmarium DSM 5974 TaxID=1121340 RepID=A0A2T0AXP9_9CLOT|nr:hypothetical protein [Clostridium thermopalmarium]PRR75664.1 hypothetical protein CPAL_04950 [Clostridium thermopalmarium DSM 5974]PVZ26648.1 hypothetical protein LX19_00726 [Clostridium thermopalmarium DSM 5974]